MCSIEEDLSNHVTSSNQNDQTDDLSDELNNKLSFDPPLYIQRYDYVLNYLNKFKCKTIMDIGCAECKFIHFLKQMNDDLNLIVGVDMDDEVLEKGKNKFTNNLVDIIHPRKNPLDVFIIKGDISQPDKYFLDKFSYENSGLEFVSLIEIIEHMYEDTLDKCIDTVFSKLKPKYVLITTPNSEFNIVFEELDQNNNREHDERKINPKFRHWDHKFEWTRLEFETWCQNRILNQYKQYKLFNNTYDGLGEAPSGYENIGFCTQIALFVNEDYCQENNTTNDFQVYLKEKKRIYLKNRNLMPDEKVKQDMYYQPNDTHSFENSKRFKMNTNEEYKVIHSFNYPFELYEFENESDRNEVLLDELYHAILFVTTPSKYSKYSYTQNSCDNNDILSGHLTEEEIEKLNNDIDLYDDTIRLAKVEILFDFNSIKKFNLTQKELIQIMKENKFQFTKNDKYVIHTIKCEESPSESSSSSSVVEYEDSYYSKKNLDNYFEINEKMSIEMNESFESKATSNSEFFDDENWDIYFCEQEPIHTTNSNNKKPTLVDQFEDADGNDYTWSEEYIQKCLNFQPKSRRDRLRLSDFNSYNYNYENQKKITYNLRAARKKNRVCSLDTFELNKEQFTLD